MSIANCTCAELSSFQLETTSSLQSAAATVSTSLKIIWTVSVWFATVPGGENCASIYGRRKVVNADDALTMPVRGADERRVSFGVNRGLSPLIVKAGRAGRNTAASQGERCPERERDEAFGQHNAMR